DEAAFVKTLDLLSYKPIIYVANVSDEDLVAGGDNEYVQQVRKIAEGDASAVSDDLMSGCSTGIFCKS
ncbi:MAG: hypothetical protein IKC05_05615, partial [Lentisphaeria bacterium]|nr:hypothetical protein [Lentisphaeria bacterium]